MKAAIKTITPSQAQEMLKKNQRNRPIDSNLLASYAGAMQRGEWVLNGEPIIFSDDGILLDGQHRLAASVRSGVPFQTLCVEGIAGNAQPTIDRGKSRTPGNVLQMMGEAKASRLGAALSVMHRFFSGTMATSTRASSPTTSQLIDLLNKHPGIRHSAGAAGKHRRNFCPPGIYDAFHYIFGMDDPNEDNSLRDEFFNQLRLDYAGARHSATQLLFTRLMQNATSRTSKTPPLVVAALFIKAWIAFRDNKEIKVLKWNPTLNEEFPKL